MDHVEAHAIKLLSMLNEFRAIQRYTDVTIEFENKSFVCHRVALSATCEYFDTLFSSRFKDSTSESIAGLKDIMSAATFQEILRFMYEGNAEITSENVYDLLMAIEFLRFRRASMEDLCVKFIEENRSTLWVVNKFKIFKFALNTGRQFLSNMLLSDLAKELGQFIKTSDFLEVSRDDLISMVNHRCTLLNEDSLLTAII